MKYFLFFSLACMALALNSCKKTSSTPEPYRCTTCKSTPTAVAANDNSSKGVYKGVEIGSSGTIMIDIANTTSAITASMVMDGTTVNFTSNATVISGQTFTGTFTATINGQPATFTFSVAANGNMPTIGSYTIPGHNSMSFVVYKELSSALVSAFEGTYSTTKPETGTFNLLIQANKWTAISRKSDGTNNSSLGGTVVNNELINSNPVVTMGKVSGDVVTGSFIDSDGKKVTVDGRRTL